MKKLFTKAMSETIDDEKLFVASDEVEDRQGEIIMQDGWDLSGFKKNPIIQWAHNFDEPAIATAKKIGFKTINGKKKLVFRPLFHRKTPMSNYIADLVEAGIIKASSVGFRPIKQDEDTYTKTELLEISFVNIPSNQNALALGLTKGYDKETIKAIMPDIDFKNKSVIGYTKYPLSSADSWDAGVEVKNADNADLRKMCTWYDSEKPDIKSSYKLPHHELSGYKTNWRGVTAAMAALFGARGGVDIPDVDRKGIYNHLARHYADFDKEAPEFKMAEEIVEKYVEKKGADEKLIELTKTVNTWIEEQRKETKEKKKIAETNTKIFQEQITKRFEDIEFNIQGLTEGIKPSDKGLEQRLMDIEQSVAKIANDMRTYLTSQPKGKGVIGREPKMAEGQDKESDITRRLAIKSLNKITEILNRTKE